MTKTHVVYPGDLYEEVEQLAEKRDVSVSEVYKEAIRKELQRMEDKE